MKRIERLELLSLERRLGQWDVKEICRKMDGFDQANYILLFLFSLTGRTKE